MDTEQLAEHDDRVRPVHKWLVPGAATICLTLALAGCAGSTSDTTSASPTQEANTTVLPPIPVSSGGPLAVKVGNNLNVITANVGSVDTNNETVLDVSQPYSDGSASFNGGARVLAVGKATLTVRDTNDRVLYVVDVTATD